MSIVARFSAVAPATATGTVSVALPLHIVAGPFAPATPVMQSTGARPEISGMSCRTETAEMYDAYINACRDAGDNYTDIDDALRLAYAALTGAPVALIPHAAPRRNRPRRNKGNR